MKRVNFLAASTAFILCCLAPAFGAPKGNTESSATQAETVLEQIDGWSGAIAGTAYELGNLADRQLDPRSHLEGLDTLREDINKIGSGLQTLEAERDALAPWEAKALDQISPLMHQAADNADKVIQTFNSDRQRLWATSYASDTMEISNDAKRVSTLLHDYLRLEKMQQKEQRIERDLGE